MTESVTVTVLHSDQQVIGVAGPRAAGCARCASGQGCGLGYWMRDTSPAALSLQADDDALARSLAAGEELQLQLPVPTLTRFILMALAIPAALLVTLTVLGSWLGNSVGVSAPHSAIAGFVVALISGALLARIAGSILTGSNHDTETHGIVVRTRDGNMFHAKIT